MICDLIPIDGCEPGVGFIPAHRRALLAEKRSRIRVLEKSLRFHPGRKQRSAAHQRAVAQLKNIGTVI